LNIFYLIKIFSKKKHAKYSVTVVLISLANVNFVLELKGFRHFVHPVIMDFIPLIQQEFKIAKPATFPVLLVKVLILMIACLAPK
jgi:hypothetical protein